MATRQAASKSEKQIPHPAKGGDSGWQGGEKSRVDRRILCADARRHGLRRRLRQPEAGSIETRV